MAMNIAAPGWTELVLKGFASFPYLAEPGAYKNAEPKYKLTLMMPKDDKEELGKVQSAYKVYLRHFDEMFEESEKGKDPEKRMSVEKLMKRGEFYNSLQKGKTFNDDREEIKGKNRYPEYEDKWLLKATVKQQPVMFDGNNKRLTDKSEIRDTFHAGAKVCIVCSLYAFDDTNYGIYCSLKSLKYIGKGIEVSAGGDKEDAALSVLGDVDAEDVVYAEDSPAGEDGMGIEL